MASNHYSANGNAPSRITNTGSSCPQPNHSIPAPGVTAQGNVPPQSDQVRPRRLVLPTRYMNLEPPQPLSAFDDDPIFNSKAAASILGVTAECLKKWRQRNQGPDYVQYGEEGPVRYALSALMKFRAEYTVHVGER